MSVVPRNEATHLQVVDALLSHYQEGVKPTIRSHLSSLLQEFPGLQVKTEAFPQSDGRPPCRFLQVGGTIPISFLQVIYNIPVVLWLSEEYPLRPPRVFVTPSPSMIIKTAHPLVDPTGLVSCPRLRSWVSPPSNLVDLIRSLCVSFGHDPPLYSVMLPSHARDVKLSVSNPSPLPSTSSASPSTAVSLLGPGFSWQPHPLHANGVRVPIMPLPMASPSMSASLLGPGSLFPRLLSHGHVRELSMTHLSQPQLPAMVASSNHIFSHDYSSSASIARASSPLIPLPVSSSQQHPPHVYDARVAHLSTSTSASASASLLGPGELSQGRMVIPFPAPRLTTEMSNRPSLLTQRHSSPAHDVGLPAVHHPSTSLSSTALTSTSKPASLLGPGKVLQMHPSHDAKDVSSPLRSLPAGLSSWGHCHPPHTHADGSLGLLHPPHMHAGGSWVQWDPLHTLGAGVSMALLPTASTSASLLGAGSLCQRHAAHAHAGVAISDPSQQSTLAPTSLSSCVPGAQLPAVNHAYGAGESSSSHAHNTGASSSSSISTTSSNPISSISMLQNGGSPSTSLQQHFTSPTQHVQFFNPIFGTTDPAPDGRQSVMDALIGRLQCDIDKIRKDKEMDMLKSMDIEGLLKQRQGLCEKGIRELQQQKDNLELQLQTLLINTDVLETWLVANNMSDVKIDIDDIFEPCDGLSKQLLECIASDLAIEDALYCLGKAAEEGKLPVVSYLRHVKTLSREQFFHRAIAIKVRAAQGQ